MMKLLASKKLKRLHKKIKGNWDKLTDEEITSYQERPDAFYDAVKGKYGMFKDDAERRIEQLNSGYSFFNW